MQMRRLAYDQASPGRRRNADLSGLDKTSSTQVLPIRIELENLSTLPDQGSLYRFARIVGGGALTWRGDLVRAPIGRT